MHSSQAEVLRPGSCAFRHEIGGGGREAMFPCVCVSHRVAISEDGLSHASVPLDAPRMS